MKIVIQGTKNFEDYSVFIRAMGTALSSIKDGDTEFVVFSAGPAQINSMALEFINVSERGLKARGLKPKLVKVPPSWVKSNISKIDYLAFFSKPKESVSDLVDLAESKDVSVGVYRY